METNGKWTVQELEIRKNGYEKWNTYCIRSEGNVCLATVGDVDRAYEKDYEEIARLFASSPMLYKALKGLMEQASKVAETLPDNHALWAYIDDASDALSNAGVIC